MKNRTGIRGLVAYPSSPPELGETIEATISTLRDRHGYSELLTWRQNDIAGKFLLDPFFARVASGDVLIADITYLNFNVVYEIGYAIGRHKAVVLIRNLSLKGDDDLVRQVGIFDTLGYLAYDNSLDLIAKLLECAADTALLSPSKPLNTTAPLYVILPFRKTDADIRLFSRIKKARLQFRTFDPEESGRLPAGEAMDNVQAALGVVAFLLASNRQEAEVHNIRVAFVAGLGHGLEKEVLLLQFGQDPVPLDCRDLVKACNTLDHIDGHLADFVPSITAKLQESSALVVEQPRSFLATLDLGASAAENEFTELANYYVEVDEFQRALRGELQVIIGRKGSGKTALFGQLRDRLRQNKQRIVLDLKPEGFQLLKFKERVLDLLEAGTREHTITAFWEYLLLLEICHKVLEKDRQPHLNDHRLFEPYRSLERAYVADRFISEGDFAERMTRLTERIAERYQGAVATTSKRGARLDAGQITELLYQHDLGRLREQVIEYLGFKQGLWILFDNLDKGWPAHGIKADDLVIIRCLLNALSKIRITLQKHDVQAVGVVFIRHDVFDLLLESIPDRGKLASAALDWTDADLLRELVRRRLVYNGIEGDPTFSEIWPQICVSHIQGEESSQYMIDRSMMRPRGLLDLLNLCKSHAVNVGHHVIREDDIRAGEEAYSTELVTNIGYEIRDVYTPAGEVLYEFLGSQSWVSANDLKRAFDKVRVPESEQERLLDLLLWYGVLGIVRTDTEVSYIYSVRYDLKRLKAIARSANPPVYQINPAFWAALEVIN